MLMRHLTNSALRLTTLVGMSQSRIPYSDPLVETSILLSLVSVNLQYYDGWCSFNAHCVQVANRVSKRNNDLKELAGTNKRKEEDLLLTTLYLSGAQMLTTPAWKSYNAQRMKH